MRLRREWWQNVLLVVSVMLFAYSSYLNWQNIHHIFVQEQPTILASDWEKFCQADPMGEKCQSVGIVEFDEAWFQRKNERVLPCWTYDEKTKVWHYEPDCIDLDSGDWIQ